MPRSINKVILVGRVGRDPDVQTDSKGVKVAHVSLATTYRLPRDRGDGEISMEERTEWHRLTLWDKLAEVASDYIRKGDRIYVEGRMAYDSFEKNGITVPTAEVLVRELVLLGAGSQHTPGTDD